MGCCGGAAARGHQQSPPKTESQAQQPDAGTAPSEKAALVQLRALPEASGEVSCEATGCRDAAADCEPAAAERAESCEAAASRKAGSCGVAGAQGVGEAASCSVAGKKVVQYDATAASTVRKEVGSDVTTGAVNPSDDDGNFCISDAEETKVLKKSGTKGFDESTMEANLLRKSISNAESIGGGLQEGLQTGFLEKGAMQDSHETSLQTGKTDSARNLDKLEEFLESLEIGVPKISSTEKTKTKVQPDDFLKKSGGSAEIVRDQLQEKEGEVEATVPQKSTTQSSAEVVREKLEEKKEVEQEKAAAEKAAAEKAAFVKAAAEREAAEKAAAEKDAADKAAAEKAAAQKAAAEQDAAEKAAAEKAAAQKAAAEKDAAGKAAADKAAAEQRQSLDQTQSEQVTSREDAATSSSRLSPGRPRGRRGRMRRRGASAPPPASKGSSSTRRPRGPTESDIDDRSPRGAEKPVDPAPPRKLPSVALGPEVRAETDEEKRLHADISEYSLMLEKAKARGDEALQKFSEGQLAVLRKRLQDLQSPQDQHSAQSPAPASASAPVAPLPKALPSALPAALPPVSSPGLTPAPPKTLPAPLPTASIASQEGQEEHTVEERKASKSPRGHVTFSLEQSLPRTRAASARPAVGRQDTLLMTRADSIESQDSEQKPAAGLVHIDLTSFRTGLDPLPRSDTGKSMGAQSSCCDEEIGVLSRACSEGESSNVEHRDLRRERFETGESVLEYGMELNSMLSDSGSEQVECKSTGKPGQEDAKAEQKAVTALATE